MLNSGSRSIFGFCEFDVLTLFSIAAGRTPLVELKNGKIIFKQKAIQLDKLSETLQGNWFHKR
jgi:hypothetical protein